MEAVSTTASSQSDPPNVRFELLDAFGTTRYVERFWNLEYFPHGYSPSWWIPKPSDNQPLPWALAREGMVQTWEDGPDETQQAVVSNRLAKHLPMIDSFTTILLPVQIFFRPLPNDPPIPYGHLGLLASVGKSWFWFDTQVGPHGLANDLCYDKATIIKLIESISRKLNRPTTDPIQLRLHYFNQRYLVDYENACSLFLLFSIKWIINRHGNVNEHELSALPGLVFKNEILEILDNVGIMHKKKYVL